MYHGLQAEKYLRLSGILRLTAFRMMYMIILKLSNSDIVLIGWCEVVHCLFHPQFLGELVRVAIFLFYCRL